MEAAGQGRDGLDTSTRPAPRPSSRGTWRRQCLTPHSRRTAPMPAPCLACHRSPDRAWDTGPVAGGSNVSTPDQASQALSMRIRWDRSEMPELCTRPSRGWQMAAHTVTRARGRRAAQEGGTPKPLPPPPRGGGGHARGPLLSRGGTEPAGFGPGNVSHSLFRLSVVEAVWVLTELGWGRGGSKGWTPGPSLGK